MQTSSVLFIFHFGSAELPLQFYEDVPSTLITQATAANSSEYQQLFEEVKHKVVAAHQDEILPKDPENKKRCTFCIRKAIRFLNFPMSVLVNQEQPHICIFCARVCGAPLCETKGWQYIDRTMAVATKDQPPTVYLRCKMCGATGNVSKCSRCSVAAYCGKECQKNDWRFHKKACVAWDEWQSSLDDPERELSEKEEWYLQKLMDAGV